MGLVLSDVARKQEIHFNKRMLTFVTTLFLMTILLWPLDKNVDPPGGKKHSMFISKSQQQCFYCLWRIRRIRLLTSGLINKSKLGLKWNTYSSSSQPNKVEQLALFENC